MPCMDYRGPDDGSWERERKLEKRNDLLAGMLCAILTAAEKEIGVDGVNNMLKDLRDGVEHTYKVKDAIRWWEDHKAADVERKEREVRERAEAEKRKEAERVAELKKLEELARKHGKKVI